MEGNYSKVFSVDEESPKILVCFWIPHVKVPINWKKLLERKPNQGGVK